MTYSEFKAFLLTHLWKMGDSLVLDNLPTIIKVAEAELNRKLKTGKREATATLTVADGAAYLPADYQSMQLLFNDNGKMQFVSGAAYANMKARRTCGTQDYTTRNNKVLYARGADGDKLECWYYAEWFGFGNVDYSQPDEMPLYGPVEDYFDVYLYCVLKHTAPFLREDERLTVWAGLYEDALNSALEEYHHEVKLAGAPLKIDFGRNVR